MNVNVVSLGSKDHSTTIVVGKKFFSLNTYVNRGGKFVPGPPAHTALNIKEKFLTTIGRIGKQLISAPMGTVKTVLLNKRNYAANALEPVMTVSLAKELTKKSLYSITFMFPNVKDTFTYEFEIDPCIEITSEDISVEMWSTDYFMDFLNVLSVSNLSIFKTLSVDPTAVAVISNKNGNIETKKFSSDPYENTKKDDDIPF